VVYSQFGPPRSVLRLEERTLSEPKENEVLVQLLYAAVNHGDINLIQGRYGNPLRAKPPPAVAGSEGVGKVVSVGRNVSSIKVNDLVVPTAPAAGTWSTHMVANEKDLFRVPNQIKPQYAAMFSSPLVASLLLSEFVQLKPGDVVIQNGANGAIGTAVVQLASQLGVKTINILDSRNEDSTAFSERLKKLGAYIVVDEEYAQKYLFKELISDLPKPRLALNSIGGPSATELARHLAPGGTLVTYGGASLKPLQIPSSLFIFNQINLTGFWLPRWLEETPVEKKNQVLQKVAESISLSEYQQFGEMFEFKDYQIALKEFQERGRIARTLLSF